MSWLMHGQQENIITVSIWDLKLPETQITVYSVSFIELYAEIDNGS